MMIHVMRSIALLFRCSCIASSCDGARPERKYIRERGTLWRICATHQVVRAADALVQALDALSDLKVRPARLVQRVQARIFPEYTRHVEHVAPEDDVPAQREELACQPHRVAPREC